MSVPYVVDETSNVARTFGASVTPEAFLFAADGKLAYHGTIDDNRADPDRVTAHYLDALATVAAGHCGRRLRRRVSAAASNSAPGPESRSKGRQGPLVAEYRSRAVASLPAWTPATAGNWRSYSMRTTALRPPERTAIAFFPGALLCCDTQVERGRNRWECRGEI